MAGENRRLLYMIQRRKLQYFGQVMKHSELLRVIMKGIGEGTKARGLQRKMNLDDICTRTNQKKENLIIRKCKDGESIT